MSKVAAHGFDLVRWCQVSRVEPFYLVRSHWYRLSLGSLSSAAASACGFGGRRHNRSNNRTLQHPKAKPLKTGLAYGNSSPTNQPLHGPFPIQQSQVTKCLDYPRPIEIYSQKIISGSSAPKGLPQQDILSQVSASRHTVRYQTAQKRTFIPFHQRCLLSLSCNRQHLPCHTQTDYRDAISGRQTPPYWDISRNLKEACLLRVGIATSGDAESNSPGRRKHSQQR